MYGRTVGMEHWDGIQRTLGRSQLNAECGMNWCARRDLGTIWIRVPSLRRAEEKVRRRATVRAHGRTNESRTARSKFFWRCPRHGAGALIDRALYPLVCGLVRRQTAS